LRQPATSPSAWEIDIMKHLNHISVAKAQEPNTPEFIAELFDQIWNGFLVYLFQAVFGEK